MKNPSMRSYMPVKYEKHLCYAMQASVILDFNHTNNRGLLNSPSALPFSHCQPGKRWPCKEEQNQRSITKTQSGQVWPQPLLMEIQFCPGTRCHSPSHSPLSHSAGGNCSKTKSMIVRIFKIHYSINPCPIQRVSSDSAHNAQHSVL